MFSKLIIVLIKLYQKILSPIMGNQCRFYPTCSHYALDAFQEYHFFKAGFLTLKRLWRCQPYYAGGFDPIPNHSSGVKSHERLS